MIQQTSINHLVDEIIGDKSEPFSSATSYYLLVSNDGCQTTWHQDFSATSVMYTVLTGEKIFFLLAPIKANLDLFEQYTSQETDTQLVDLVLACFFWKNQIMPIFTKMIAFTENDNVH